MNKLKSFDEFVNENLVTKGEYNFYGPGSLKPLVQKLIGEGKNESIIRTYLTSIGVAPWRIDKVMEELSATTALEKKINENESVNEGLKSTIQKLFKAAKKKLGMTKIQVPTDAEFKYAQEWVGDEFGKGHSVWSIGVDDIQDRIYLEVGEDKAGTTEEFWIDRPKDLKESVTEGSSEKDVNAFADDILAAADPSDMWDDVVNGKKYIAIETEGFNKKAEKELIATVKEIAPKHGYEYVKDYKHAKKLGVDGAYADDALMVYVGESINEGKKKTFEEKATKFLETLNEEDDEVNEKTSVKKGDYVLYKGNGSKWTKSKVMQVIPSKKKLHIDWNDEYIEVHVKDVKPVEESVNEGKKIKPFKKVKVGDKATDYNGDTWNVIAVGKVKDLMKYDDSGAAEELDPNEDAIALDGRGGTAVFSYDPDGAAVYEGEEFDGSDELNEFEMPGFWEFFMGGAGWEAGKAAFWLGLTLGMLALGGVAFGVSAVIAKAKQLWRDYNDDKAAKEAIDFFQKNPKIQELIAFGKDLIKHRKKKVDKRRKDSELEKKELKRIEKEMVKKRQALGAELVAEMKKAKLSKGAIRYLSDNVPYVSTAVKMNESTGEYEFINEGFDVHETDPAESNYKWEFEVKDKKGNDKKLFKALSSAGVEFGTVHGSLHIMGDTDAEKDEAMDVLKKFKITESEITEAKKKTFEDSAAAFLLGLQGSDAINDDKDEDKVEERLNKETLQVEEGDGEDIDDMIDDLEDGDEDEYQGPDDEAPKDGDEKDIKKGDDSDDLEAAVKKAKKDKKKLDKIEKILGEKNVTIDADGEEVKDVENIEDEKTGDEIQVEEPQEESKSDPYMDAVTEGLKQRFNK